jgi:hypothetical protein
VSLYCSRDNRQWKSEKTGAKHNRTGKPVLRNMVFKVQNNVFWRVLSLISVFCKMCLAVCDIYEKAPLWPQVTWVLLWVSMAENWISQRLSVKVKLN